MGVPAFLNSSFRYFMRSTVTDVQTIINDLYSELVTNGGWTCTQGGVGQSPTAFLSPTRADGVSFKIQLTRDSATRLSWVVTDQWGLQVNNQTNTKQDIDAGGTNIHYYTGEFHVGVNSSRATPEFFGCGVLDHDPEAIDEPRATYWATTGPRQTSGTLVTNGMGTVFRYSGTAYAAGGVATPDPYQGGTCHQLMTGEVLTAPLDVVDAAYTFWDDRFKRLSWTQLALLIRTLPSRLTTE